MKVFDYKFPTGGALHLRGLVGKVAFVDRRRGNTLTTKLDAQNAIPGKKLIVNYRGGELHSDAPNETYAETQVFSTPDVRPVYRIITPDGVFDGDGKIAQPRSRVESLELGVEIDYSASQPGSNVWFGWMINKTGRVTVTIKADGKIVSSKTVHVETFTMDRFKGVTNSSDLKFQIYSADKIKGPDQFKIGDILAFGFPISELATFKIVELIA